MRHAIRTLVVVLLAIPVLNCGSVRERVAIREGHRLYRDESFRKAIEQYKIVLANDPNNIEATFYMGSSYQQLFEPGKETTKGNLEEAIKNYEVVLAAKPSTIEPKRFEVLRRNALSAMVGIYVDDPYRDFEKAMKYATELTNSDPNNLQNLFAMANLYETFGHVPEAEAAYKKAFEVAPKDGKACGALAGFYNKTLWDEKGVPITDGGSGVGRFDDAVTQLKVCAELDPSDPKGFYTVATFYWDKCYRGGILDDGRKKKLADEGMSFVDKALSIKADFVEALIFKGLLLREYAKLTTNPAARNSYLEEAQALQKKAVDLKKEQDAALAEQARQAALVSG